MTFTININVSIQPDRKTRKRLTRLEKQMSDLNTTIDQYDADVQALIAKDTLDASERDTAQGLLDAANAKLASGSFLSDDEKQQLTVEAAALHNFLNPTVTPPPAA